MLVWMRRLGELDAGTVFEILLLLVLVIKHWPAAVPRVSKCSD